VGLKRGGGGHPRDSGHPKVQENDCLEREKDWITSSHPAGNEWTRLSGERGRKYYCIADQAAGSNWSPEGTETNGISATSLPIVPKRGIWEGSGFRTQCQGGGKQGEGNLVAGPEHVVERERNAAERPVR